MSFNDTDDEPCIIYENILPPVISQKKAEEIKRAVRSKFFGNAGNSEPHASSQSVGNAVLKQPSSRGSVVVQAQRKVDESFPKSRKVNVLQSQQKNYANTYFTNEKKEAFNCVVRSVSSTFAEVKCETPVNKNSLLNAKQHSNNQCSDSMIETPTQGSSESAIFFGSATQMVSYVETSPIRRPKSFDSNNLVEPPSISSLHQSLSFTKPEVLNIRPTSKILVDSCNVIEPSTSPHSVFVQNENKFQESNSECTKVLSSAVQCVSSHSVKGKPNVMSVQSTPVVATCNVSFPRVPHSVHFPDENKLKKSTPDVEKPEVLSAPSVKMGVSSSSLENQNYVSAATVHSKVATISQLGTLVMPVPPSKPCSHGLANNTLEKAEEILKSNALGKSITPTLNLVPTVSVKHEVCQSTVDACKEVLTTQNEPANVSKAELTSMSVRPSKSSNIKMFDKKLSPQLKAHPGKFLSQSPGQRRMPTKSSRKISPFKRSPVKYSRKKNFVGANYLSAKPFVRTLNFDEPTSREEQGASYVPDVSLTTTTLDAVYCKHFKMVLLHVMTTFYFLFSEPELEIIQNFINLSSLSKMMYIRMFSRKYSWHRVSDIVYEALGNNLASVVEELEFRDLVTLDYSGEELRTLLGLLRVPELKMLCQHLHVPISATTKEDRIEALLQYCSKQRTLSPTHVFTSVVKEQAQKMLGECFKLCEAPRHLFQRILLVFALPQRRHGPVDVLPQLLMMNEVETNKINFPKYPLSNDPLFTNREQVVSFHEADDFCNELLDVLARKKTEQIKHFSSEAKLRFMLLMENPEERARANSLPLFLRRFTACSKYAYALDMCAEALRKEKASIKTAVEILELLLEQDVFLTHYRGFWYDRLALVLHYHLHDLKKVADLIIRATSDVYVTEVQKYNLVLRGHRIITAKNNGLSKQQERDLYFSLDDYVDDPPSITIKAKALPIQGPGRKRVYVEVDAENQQTRYSSVEEYAISYYKKQGYACGEMTIQLLETLKFGYHTEGSIVSSLFALMLWDVLYELPVPSAFLGVYQEVPLDLNYPDFYISRRDVIDNRLQQIEEMSIEQLQAIVTERHAKHAGTISLVNWDLLVNVSRATVLVACLGSRLLARICERFAKNYRMARSGFPDLLVWSPTQKKCKIVEVKGPNDHLSGNQVLWLNYLIAAGADAEVCHIQTTGSKAAKRKNAGMEDLQQLLAAHTPKKSSHWRR